MFRRIFAAGLCLAFMTANAPARPPIDILEFRRIDGIGPRAFEKFRAPETRCGIVRDGSEDIKIYNTFETAILTLDFNGIKHRVLPLMFTDKTGDDNLLNHKVRTPCVLSVSRAGQDYLIALTTRIDPPGISAVLRVDAEGRLLNLQDNAGIFYVVGENSRGNRAIDRFAFDKARLQRFTCLLHETAQECEYQFLNYAERVFSDEVRHQSFWPDPGRRNHHEALDREIATRIADPVILAMHRLIIANESATISPFQLWDAVLGDSGLSFGPHQWDIGINPDAQRIFAALVDLGHLQKEFPAPGIYFKSVRRFSTGELKEIYLTAAHLNAVMQSPAGEEMLIGEYIKWLETAALSRPRASLPFLNSADERQRAMLLFYADVDNQYGAEEIKQGLRDLIQSLVATGAGASEIRKALDAYMMSTPFAKAYPDKAAARLERTWSILSAGTP